LAPRNTNTQSPKTHDHMQRSRHQHGYNATVRLCMQYARADTVIKCTQIHKYA
jgi:hypothetical protein